MRKTTWIVMSAVLVLALGSLPAQLRGAEEDKADKPLSPEAMMKVMEEAGKPGPEHSKLDPLVGEWTYTSKVWMDPSQPPMESSGTIKRHWILGKRFLEERVVGKGPDGKSEFEGRGIIGYDKVQGKYTYGWICSMGTGMSSGLGTYDADGKQFKFATETYCPIRGTKIQGRDEIRVESDDKHVVESYMSEDGKEAKAMELTAVRKK